MAEPCTSTAVMVLASLDGPVRVRCGLRAEHRGPHRVEMRWSQREGAPLEMRDGAITAPVESLPVEHDVLRRKPKELLERQLSALMQRDAALAEVARLKSVVVEFESVRSSLPQNSPNENEPETWEYGALFEGETDPADYGVYSTALEAEENATQHALEGIDTWKIFRRHPAPAPAGPWEPTP